MHRAGFVLASLFLVLSLPYLGRPGIQDDEALFANAVFRPYTVVYSAQAFGHQLPLMLMSYVGTLKAYLFKAFFVFVDPSAASIRLPMILAGAVTVWLFVDLLRRTLGARAAWIGGLLLATDASFLLTRKYDWGPCALAQLLALAGAWLIRRFVESGQAIWLFLGFFVFGLGLWDKALFLWILAGLGLATLVVFPTFVRRLLAPRLLLLASLGFALGAYPFLRYNVSKKQATFSENVNFVVQEPMGKVEVMKRTLEGTVLLGWLVRDAGQPIVPSMMFWLLIGCVAATPFFFHRAFLFALIAFLVIWTLMVFTRDAGGAAHHTVLVWPLPQLMIAVVLSRTWDRLGKWLPMVVTVVALAANLGVIGRFYRDLDRYGGGQGWSDAIYRLSDDPVIRNARTVGVADWGFIQTLHLLHRGTLNTRYLDEASLSDQAPQVRAYWRKFLTADGVVMVEHTPGYQFYPATSKALGEFATTHRLRRELLRTVTDRFGRPVFEISRYWASSAEGP